MAPNIEAFASFHSNDQSLNCPPNPTSRLRQPCHAKGRAIRIQTQEVRAHRILQAVEDHVELHGLHPNAELRCNLLQSTIALRHHHLLIERVPFWLLQLPSAINRVLHKTTCLHEPFRDEQVIDPPRWIAFGIESIHPSPPEVQRCRCIHASNRLLQA